MERDGPPPNTGAVASPNNGPERSVANIRSVSRTLPAPKTRSGRGVKESDASRYAVETALSAKVSFGIAFGFPAAANLTVVRLTTTKVGRDGVSAERRWLGGLVVEPKEER